MLFLSYCILALISIALCRVPLPRLPSLPAVGAQQQPTCIPGPNSPALDSSTKSLHPLSISTYAIDCLLALTPLGNSAYSHQAWTWKRFDPGQVPPPGYAPLPYEIVTESCTVELDVLSDVTAEDEIALPTLELDLMSPLKKCIKVENGGFAAGYVLVGPKRLIALTFKPTPKGFDGRKGKERDRRISGGGGDRSDGRSSSTDIVKDAE